jgi:divalent metal cation (Fe/Co/Zn/Cd) transporter
MTFLDKFQSIFSRKSIPFNLKINAICLFLLSIYNIAFALASNHSTSYILGLSLLINSAYVWIIYYAEKNKNINPEYSFNYGYTKNESIFILVHLFISMMIILLLIFYIFTRYNPNHNLKIDSQITILSNILFSTFIMFLIKKNCDKNIANIKNIELCYNYIVWKNTFIIFFASFVASSFIILFLQANNAVFSNYFDLSVSVLIAIYLFVLPLKNINFAIRQLLDNTVSDEIQFNIIAVIVENLQNFCEFKSLHVRFAGKKLFIEIDVVLPWDFTIEQKFSLEKHFEKQIKEIYPNSIFRLYVLPCNRECITENRIQCPLKKLK